MPRSRMDAPTWNAAHVPPDWLSAAAPEVDVCLSSRMRIMRNIAGYRFPHCAPQSELREVLERVLEHLGAPQSPKWTVLQGLGPAERELLVADRLISADFEFQKPHRAVLLDAKRRLSVMVNEEDHLRFQILTAGWSLADSSQTLSEIVRSWAETLAFAFSPRFGYLSASLYNCGAGVRHSAMFHLIGLAHLKRLKPILNALQVQKIIIRGPFGENSRAVGAMVQLSATGDELPLIQGAGEFLIAEERKARAQISLDELRAKAIEAREFAIGSRSLGLADALRVQAWVRWAASIKAPGFPKSVRDVDRWIRDFGFGATSDDEPSARKRAAVVREALEAHR